MAIRHSHVIFFGCSAFFLTFSGYVYITERSDKQKLKTGAVRDIDRYQKKLADRLQKQAELDKNENGAEETS